VLYNAAANADDTSASSMPFIRYCSVFVCSHSACVLLYSFVYIVYCKLVIFDARLWVCTHAIFRTRGIVQFYTHIVHDCPTHFLHNLANCI